MVAVTATAVATVWRHFIHKLLVVGMCKNSLFNTPECLYSTRLLIVFWKIRNTQSLLLRLENTNLKKNLPTKGQIQKPAETKTNLKPERQNQLIAPLTSNYLHVLCIYTNLLS